MVHGRESNPQESKFGRYRLLEELGAGGMAVVTRAVVDGPKGFEREIVIKRILREHSYHPSFARMLATEARLSARLRHPGIVQVHEFGEVDGEYYLAMELVEGCDLSALVKACKQRQLRLPLGVAAYIVSQVASALAYAHALTDDDGQPLGIVHRDVSPSNIMVTALGGVKLLDFGIAKVTDKLRQDQTRTSVGSLKGKLSYLSPEQCEGRELDGRSDIFALGIVFYELMTLDRLYRGKTEIETMSLIREGNVAPPSTRVDGIPPEVDALVLRMLAPWPEQRFADCDALWAALAELTRQQSGDAVALRRFLQELGPVGRAMPAPLKTPRPSPSPDGAMKGGTPAPPATPAPRTQPSSPSSRALTSEPKTQKTPSSPPSSAEPKTRSSPSSPALPTQTALADEETRASVPVLTGEEARAFAGEATRASVPAPTYPALGAGDDAEETIVDVQPAQLPAAYHAASTVVGHHAAPDVHAVSPPHDAPRPSLPPLERRWLIMALAAVIALLGSLAWIVLARSTP